jgi:hypothetical protein
MKAARMQSEFQFELSNFADQQNMSGLENTSTAIAV